MIMYASFSLWKPKEPCRQSYHDRAPVEIRHKAPARLHGIRNSHRARLADVDFVYGDFQHSSSHLEPQDTVYALILFIP